MQRLINYLFIFSIFFPICCLSPFSLWATGTPKSRENSTALTLKTEKIPKFSLLRHENALILKNVGVEGNNCVYLNENQTRHFPELNPRGFFFHLLNMEKLGMTHPSGLGVNGAALPHLQDPLCSLSWKFQRLGPSWDSQIQRDESSSTTQLSWRSQGGSQKSPSSWDWGF